jgi:hypothetical protein
MPAGIRKPENAMEKQLGRKLGSLFGLVVFGLILFLGFYHFSQRFASESSVHNLMRQKARPDTFYQETLLSDAARGRYVLHLNQSQSIGKVNLIYRGLAGKSICRIDVIIPELDPDRPYRYNLDIETAEKGFRMAGTAFKLETWQKNYIRIVKTAAGNM